MRKKDVLTNTVKHLFNTIDDNDILREVNGSWVYQDKVISPEVQKLLCIEAEQFTKGKLWKILQDDIKWQANKKMFTESQSLDDLVLGKAWLYVLDCIKTRLESMNKGRGAFNTKFK